MLLLLLLLLAMKSTGIGFQAVLLIGRTRPWTPLRI